MITAKLYIQNWIYGSAHNRLLPAVISFSLTCRESVIGVGVRRTVSLWRVLEGLVSIVFSRCGRFWRVPRWEVAANQVLWNPVKRQRHLPTVARSVFAFGSVIHGVGEMDLKLKDGNLGIKAVDRNMPREKPCPDCPYLLLDLRDREEFDSCHIISGMRQSLPVGSFKQVLIF